MFIAYEVARQLICELRTVADTLKRHNRDAADQLVRAGTSVLLNLGEGARRQGGDQKRFYAMSHGSASEVRAVLDVADAWGWSADAAKPRKTLDRLLGLLWGLTH
jgi:four helix bundle protein